MPKNMNKFYILPIAYLWVSVFKRNRASLQNSQKEESLVRKDFTCKINLTTTDRKSVV